MTFSNLLLRSIAYGSLPCHGGEKGEDIAFRYFLLDNVAALSLEAVRTLLTRRTGSAMWDLM
jgi:hypothetical protein